MDDIDTEQNTITVTVGEDKDAWVNELVVNFRSEGKGVKPKKPTKLVDLPVAKDAEIISRGKELTLADLKKEQVGGRGYVVARHIRSRLVLQLAVVQNQIVVSSITMGE